MHRQIHCKKLIWYKADRNLLIAQEKKVYKFIGSVFMQISWSLNDTWNTFSNIVLAPFGLTVAASAIN